MEDGSIPERCNKDITFREYRDSDSADLVPFIARTWGYDKYFKDYETGYLMTEAYLDFSLAEQNYNCVVEKDGKAVGIVIGEAFNKHRKLLFKYRMKTLKILFKVKNFKDKVGIVRLAWVLTHGYRVLDHKTREKFGAELNFFIIDESIRGKGIGKALLDKVEEYFRSNQVEKYYLYTDDGSNYGFYDHMGMAKIAETPISFRPYEAGDIHLYLYEKIF